MFNDAVATLLDYLQAKGLSQRELAKAIDYTPVQVNAIAKGRAKATEKFCFAASAVLGVDPYVLYRDLNGHPRVIRGEVSSQVPIIGRVQAGQSVHWGESEGTVDVATDSIKENQEYYAVIVDGDSMIGDLIGPGDILVVQPYQDGPLPEGKLLIVSRASDPDGGAMLKRVTWNRQMQAVILRSSNPAVEPILIPEDDLVVKGIVTQLIRRNL